MADEGEIRPGYLLPGTKIGFYEVVTLAGSGGFGALYKVTRDDETLGLKLSTFDLSQLTEEERQHQEERVDREVVALKSLRHPNIVKVHAFERWPNRRGYPYIVMDFVEGHRLYDWRMKLTPSLRRIAEVFRKIALALDEMHRIEVFHRDLKSENVLVRADGEPIIVDFGISRPRSTYTVTHGGKVMGTYSYFTPEYCRFQRSSEFVRGERFPYRATSDLHCVGYMLYHCLTGRPPFLSDPKGAQVDLLEEIENVVPHEPHVVNPSVPGRLSAIVMTLLEKEPAQRYQSGKELADAISEALDLADPSWDSPLEVPPRRGPGDDTRPSARVAQPASLPGPPVPNHSRALEDTLVRPERHPDPTAALLDSDAPGDARFMAPTSSGSQAASLRNGDTKHHGPIALPSSIREASNRIEAARASAARARFRPLLTIGIVAAVVLILLGLMYLGARDSRPTSTEQPRSLLADTERRERTTQGDLPAPMPQPGSTEVTSGEKAVPGALEEGKKSNDAAEIDALLAKHYGRPKVSGATTSPTASGPSWLQRGQRVDGAAAPAVTGPPKRFGVPLGAKLRVRLLSNLDSRTIGSGPVEAMLTRPYVQGGRVVLPSRTMIYGRAATNSGRFTLELNRLRLPDLAEVKFEGLAMDTGDGKPGLLATGRIAGTPPASQNALAAIARGAGSAALGKVQGEDGVDLARGAGQTALAATGQGAVGGGSAETLLLDSGMDFDVFVKEAF